MALFVLYFVKLINLSLVEAWKICLLKIRNALSSCLRLVVSNMHRHSSSSGLQSCVLSCEGLRVGMQMSVHATNLLCPPGSNQKPGLSVGEYRYCGSVCTELLKVCVQACVLATGKRGHRVSICSLSYC